MITELAIWGACAYALKKFFNKDLIKVKNDLNNILCDTRSEGIRNKNDETFNISKVYRKDYGFLVTAHIPWGCSSESIIKMKKIIEDNLSCICEITKNKFQDYVAIKIITNALNKKEFEPVKTRSNELFLGYKYDGTPYILDLNKDPHILFAGKTGSGKSFLLANVLTNHIYHHANDVEIYLLQKMKGEINIFKDCPGVKFASNDEKEIIIMLEKLSKKIHERSLLFAEHGVKNITQWNKHFPKRKMKRILIISEEISFFMDEEGAAFGHFTGAVKAGRSAGVHFMGLTQRTTVQNLGGNGELKSQMTVVTAKQRSELDSRNAIDIPDAASLEELEFISSCNDGYVLFKSCWVDEDFKALNKYVKEIKIPHIGDFKEVKNIKNDPNMTTIDYTHTKEHEHQEWCRKHGIKITEMDLVKIRQEKQEELAREYNQKVNSTKPAMINKKKGKVALNEEVAADANR